MDWKSCWSNTLSLAAGHKAHTHRDRERGRKISVKRSNSIGGNKGVEENEERWDGWIERKREWNSEEDVNKDGKKHQRRRRRSEGGEEASS